MTPGVYNMDIYRGDTYRWTFKLWTDPDRTVPADLTGVVAKAEIRDRPGGKKITLLTTTINDPDPDDSDTNRILVVLSSDSSQDLPAKGSWDLQLTYASGDVATVLGGAVAVTPDTTDSG